ncbi:MAG: hypothetical protein KME07_20115 [Pegethrix bostrychoides GSE-TBD4-15B]|jgi:DNA repair ATPase RecN|uniref:LTXXQ motif protein n=1 Tax=Pegethrix bostrychoides GSE-TBD4-15B TaxID=2839662 RepID=A0A951PFR9_9CYAN|nr:hypothetical protein [Pegethrix bostrychoides GSE-TBD4-15B]
MKRLLIALSACFCLLGFSVPPAESLPLALLSPQPIAQLSFPGFGSMQLTPEQEAAVNQLETEIIPQIEALLRPDQLAEFNLQVEDGKSFRKAFKSLTLDPDQKKSLAGLIKSLPKSDAFATLTPDQKRAYFLSHKTLFKPTPDEIATRIQAGVEAKGGTIPSIQDIIEKIKTSMSGKSSFAPSSEEIADKIKAGMKDKGIDAPSIEEITEKINMGMKKKEMYMPTPEEIGEKISAKMKLLTDADE